MKRYRIKKERGKWLLIRQNDPWSTTVVENSSHNQAIKTMERMEIA